MLIKTINIIDATEITNPIADAVAIDFLISCKINVRYGTESVPPPMPISELITPFTKKPLNLRAFFYKTIKSLNNLGSFIQIYIYHSQGKNHNKGY